MATSVRVKYNIQWASPLYLILLTQGYYPGGTCLNTLKRLLFLQPMKQQQF